VHDGGVWITPPKSTSDPDGGSNRDNSPNYIMAFRMFVICVPLFQSNSASPILEPTLRLESNFFQDALHALRQVLANGTGASELYGCPMDVKPP